MEKDKQLNWGRDEVFIIGVNDSVKDIEKIEINVYGDPMLIYPFFSSISALYSKSHKYIDTKKNINNKLIGIRKGLYDSIFLRDIKNDKNSVLVQKQFEKLLDGLVNIYRDMIEDYTDVGMFAKINLADKTPGVVRGR